MNSLKLRIVGNGVCQNFSKEYFESCILTIDSFREFIPSEELNHIFRLGAGLTIRFDKEKIIELYTIGIIDCSLDGILLHYEDVHSMRKHDEVEISFGKYQFVATAISNTNQF